MRNSTFRRPKHIAHAHTHTRRHSRTRVILPQKSFFFFHSFAFFADFAFKIKLCLFLPSHCTNGKLRYFCGVVFSASFTATFDLKVRFENVSLFNSSFPTTVLSHVDNYTLFFQFLCLFCDEEQREEGR